MAKRLLLLNGIAVLGVIFNHAAGWGWVSMFWWAHRYMPVTSPDFSQMGSTAYFALRFVEQLIIFAIPAFLFVSGFFAAFATGRGRPTVGWNFVGTRIRYLLIPYLVWSLIMIALNIAEGQSYTPLQLARTLLFGQVTPAFYFVPLLIQLYLLAPLLVRLARTRMKLLLVGALLIQSFVMLLRYAQMLNLELPLMPVLNLLTPAWFFPGNLFWFSFGVVVGFHQTAVKAWLGRYRWHFAAAVVVLIPLGMMEWEAILRASGQEWLTPKETLLDNVYSFVFILGFLAFDGATNPVTRLLNELGSRSFGIYLVHSIILAYTARGIYHLAPALLGMQGIFQPLLIISGLAIPLLLMALVKHSPARRIYAYQFG